MSRVKAPSRVNNPTYEVDVLKDYTDAFDYFGDNSLYLFVNDRLGGGDVHDNFLVVSNNKVYRMELSCLTDFMDNQFRTPGELFNDFEYANEKDKFRDKTIIIAQSENQPHKNPKKHAIQLLGNVERIAKLLSNLPDSAFSTGEKQNNKYARFASLSKEQTMEFLMQLAEKTLEGYNKARDQRNLSPFEKRGHYSSEELDEIYKDFGPVESFEDISNFVKYCYGEIKNREHRQEREDRIERIANNPQNIKRQEERDRARRKVSSANNTRSTPTANTGMNR